MDNTKVQLKREVVERLMKLKQIGDSYTDVIRRLLDSQEVKKERVIKHGPAFPIKSMVREK